jgi:hypothetical protein
MKSSAGLYENWYVPNFQTQGHNNSARYIHPGSTAVLNLVLVGTAVLVQYSSTAVDLSIILDLLKI